MRAPDQKTGDLAPMVLESTNSNLFLMGNEGNTW